MCGIFDWDIVPPEDILVAMRTRRSKAAVRDFSLASLAEMTTSERMEGMKCRSEGWLRLQSRAGGVGARRCALAKQDCRLKRLQVGEAAYRPSSGVVDRMIGGG